MIRLGRENFEILTADKSIRGEGCVRHAGRVTHVIHSAHGMQGPMEMDLATVV